METTRRGLPRAIVDDVFSAPVHINAGGTIYTTTLNTLTRYPGSKLAQLFDGTLPISIDPINRQYFIDVNGSVFVHILDFLRYGELLLPDDFTQLPLLVKLAGALGLDEMLKCLTIRRSQHTISSQNKFDEDNYKRRQGISKAENNCLDKGFKEMNIDKSTVDKKIEVNVAEADNIRTTSFETQNIRSGTIALGAMKSDTLDLKKMEVKMAEADNMRTEKLETGSIQSDVTHMVSVEAVNVEMKSIEAGAVKTSRLEVGTLMAQDLKIGTLNAGALETGISSGNAKVVLVHCNYYNSIDVYSPDEITLMDSECPAYTVQSQYIKNRNRLNCNRLHYHFSILSCNGSTTYLSFLSHLFERLLLQGYRFSSVVNVGESNEMRDYVLIQFPSAPSRP